MTETWLRTNTRALWFAMSLPAVLMIVGLFLTFGLGGWIEAAWPRYVGAALLVIAVLLVGLLLVQMKQPRIACRPGELLLYLRMGSPVRVPLDVVEGFLLGHGPSLLPGEQHARTQTSTVVIKLSERAEEWQKVDVHPRLASWCDYYVTIRGTWCEPISVAVANRLNARLAEAHARQKQAASKVAS
jgi:hypothetical protein